MPDGREDPYFPTGSRDVDLRSKSRPLEDGCSSIREPLQAASSRNCDRRCRQLVTGPSGSPSIAGRCSAPSRIHACSRERRATWLPSFEPGLCALARTMSDVRCTPSRSLSIHRRSIRCAHGYNSGRATARPDIQTMHEQHLALGVLRSLAPASTSLAHICAH